MKLVGFKKEKLKFYNFSFQNPTSFVFPIEIHTSNITSNIRVTFKFHQSCAIYATFYTMRAAVQGGGCPWRPGASIGVGGGWSRVSCVSLVSCASRVSCMSCVSFVSWLSYLSCASRVYIVSCVSSVSCLSCVSFLLHVSSCVSCVVPRATWLVPI